jgi:hypothetical protein
VRRAGWGRINPVDVFLYGAAAVSYISLSVYFKWLLDWIVGPLWLVMWVWGGPALWRFFHGEPIRPQRGPKRPVAGDP